MIIANAQANSIKSMLNKNNKRGEQTRVKSHGVVFVIIVVVV